MKQFYLCMHNSYVILPKCNINRKRHFNATVILWCYKTEQKLKNSFSTLPYFW